VLYSNISTRGRQKVSSVNQEKAEQNKCKVESSDCVFSVTTQEELLSSPGSLMSEMNF